MTMRRAATANHRPLAWFLAVSGVMFGNLEPLSHCRSADLEVGVEASQDEAGAQPVGPAVSTIKRGKDATALVDVGGRGIGSAVCVSTDGLFVTNHHVVSSLGLGSKVRLILNPGLKSERHLGAKVVKLGDDVDLALLKVDASPTLVTLEIGGVEDLVETMPVTVFGYPFGQMLATGNEAPAVSINQGKIAALRRKDGDLDTIQFDAVVNPGNSGGPLVDDRGRIVGLVVGGYPGTQINFAIPAHRVRAFLEGPALVPRNPGLTFHDRERKRQFEIDAYAFDRRSLDGLSIEVSLSTSPEDHRTFKATRDGDRFVVEAEPCPADEAPPEAMLVVRKGRGTIRTALPKGDLAIGNRMIPWSAIESIEKDGDDWIVSPLEEKRFAVKKLALPDVTYANGRTSALATADRIEVRVDKPTVSEVEYELLPSSGDKDFPPINGTFPIAGVPKPIFPGFDSPIARIQGDQPVVIEALVATNMKLQVTRSGIRWVFGEGLEDDQGRHLVVNGRGWYPGRSKPQAPAAEGGASPLLPILFGERESQVHLLWSRRDSNSTVDRDRVGFEVKKEGGDDLATVTISNRAKEPTRFALAVTTYPSGEFNPVAPPRRKEVVESHWPLDDPGNVRVVDLGPAKHEGRTSRPQIVPDGVVGDALELDRSTIVCPGVLDIDIADPFTLISWAERRPGSHGCFFSKMDNTLHGFEFGIGDTIAAHLISSWQGDALRVCAIEPLAPDGWHQIAVTYDGSRRADGLKLYFDGGPATAEITHDSLRETIRNKAPFAIGSRERRDYCQGRVDEFRAYRRALTADEIFELYDRDRSGIAWQESSALKQGLVGHWSFDGASGEQFRDKTGQGHDGQPVPESVLPTIVESDGSRAVRFEGGAFLDCGPLVDFDRTDAYSLGAWVKPKGEGFRALMGTITPAEKGFDLFFDGRFGCHFVGDWDASTIRSATRSKFPNDAWYHVVCTYNGSSKALGYKIYVNGVDTPHDADYDSLTTPTKTHGSFVIGSRIGRDYFRGDIDDAFVYRRALSAEEARAWFDRGRKGIPTTAGIGEGLVGLWTFEGKGDDAFRTVAPNGARHFAGPEIAEGHSTLVANGPSRVASFRGIGGILCGDAGDFEFDEPFSAGGWFLCEPGKSQSLISKMLPLGRNRGYELQYAGNRFVAYLIHDWSCEPKNAIDLQSAPFTKPGWHHVFMTYDGRLKASGLKIHIDGEPIETSPASDHLTGSIRCKEPFIIGSRFTGMTMYGRASHARAIPRTLSAEEVRALSKMEKPDDPSQ
ncbi:LamG-like jellyroll fold domain-containing protein [Singulisphaera rosea]